MPKKEIYASTPLSVLRSALGPVLFTLAVILVIVRGLDQTERANRGEAARLLEEGLRRAIVTCYAVEGSYPESVSYIEEHYGVRIDREKYAVHYEIFASNILPGVTVIDLTAQDTGEV